MPDGNEMKILSQIHTEREDGEAPKRWGQEHDGSDGGSNPLYRAVLRLVVKGTRKVGVQFRARRPTMPMDHP